MDAETGGGWERELAAGLRRGDAGAFRALVDRCAPLLVAYGRRFGLHADEGEELAMDALADLALELAAARRPAGGDLARRAGALFRARACAEKGERQRHLDCARDARAYVERERPVPALPGTVSEASARLARGADWEAAAPPPAAVRLAAWLDARLGDDERLLLAYVSEHAPQRVVAEWLGVSHAAARKRLSRLRERLAREADAFLEGLAAPDRRELERLLGRGGRGAPAVAMAPGARGAPTTDLVGGER